MRLIKGKKYITKGKFIVICTQNYVDNFIIQPVNDIRLVINNRADFFSTNTCFEMWPNGVHKYGVKALDIVAEYKPIKTVLPLP